MVSMVMARGEDIYMAAIEGAKRGYNRSTDDYEQYEKSFSSAYESLMANSKRKSQRKGIRSKTKNNWRDAYLPLNFLMIHEHIALEPSEPHVRVMMQESMAIFDIPIEEWNRLIEVGFVIA